MRVWIEYSDGYLRWEETFETECEATHDAIREAIEAEVRRTAEKSPEGSYEIDVEYEAGDLAGEFSVEIECDQDALIRDAIPGWATSCGLADDDHTWVATVEVDGGLEENPGVHSLGGTALSFASHCEKCGLRRVETVKGPQRNLCESDSTFEYSFDEGASWIQE